MSKVPGIPPKRALPSKESSLFKELLQLYETRQLKKGLKTADQILKKFPEHGETICMKGLVLTHMGKRDEGIDLVKKGVRLDLTSHICWHVFGLIQKGEKNYEEALKSYTQALRFDKDNLNILRDAAQLQTQLRIFDGLVDTRYTLLRIRPNVRQNWLALAVAHHLNGNLPEARKTLEHYEHTLKNVPDRDIEHSETLLYHVTLLEELGDYPAALSIIDTSARSRAIVDRTAILETRARLLSKQHSPEAQQAWRALIEHNPDCYDYYRGYLASQDIDLDTPTPDALPILLSLSDELPRAAAPKRLALTVAPDDPDTFMPLVRAYLLAGLTKGVPSLFADVKSLYVNPKKQQAIEDIVEGLRSSSSSPPKDPSSQPETENPSSSDTDPSTHLWTLYFLAQHYSHLSHQQKALTVLSEALSHTPTLPELLMCQARVLKRAGDPLGAARAMNDARLLDGQDRSLNTKAGKYLLRAGMVKEAEEVLGLFTKKDAVSPAADLEDMQSLLYLLEEANAHRRNRKLNLALKKYMAIHKVFNEVEDDQYDFHGYNIRKFTVNIYLKLLTWEDKLRSHPAYVEAAVSAAQIYIAVHDDPSLVTGGSSSGQLTDAEKKAKKKAKKAEKKVQEDTKKTPQSTNEDKGLEVPVKDDDPDGLKLLGVSDPLEQAAKLLNPLTTLTPERVDVWVAVFDVALRRKKLLQAVRALNHARALDPENPEVHIRIVDLKKAASSLPQDPPAPIGPLVASSLPSLIPDTLSLDTFNSQYLQQHSTSAPAMIAAAKALKKLDASVAEVENTVFMTLGEEVGLDILTAQKAVDFLTSLKSPRAAEYRAACDARFPLSTIFKDPAELEPLRQAVLAGEVGPSDSAEVVP